MFIRGLWDSEGSISKGRFNNKLTFTHNSLELHKLFMDTFYEVTGLIFTITKKREQGNYVTYSYNKKHIKKFYDIINPTINRKREKFKEIIASI